MGRSWRKHYRWHLCCACDTGPVRSLVLPVILPVSHPCRHLLCTPQLHSCCCAWRHYCCVHQPLEALRLWPSSKLRSSMRSPGSACSAAHVAGSQPCSESLVPIGCCCVHRPHCGDLLAVAC